MQLPAIYRDPVWQFIGAISGWIIALILYLAQRKRKELAFEILSETRLLKSPEGVLNSERLKILFDDHPVKDIQLVVLKLSNSGNQPIKMPKESSNYECPIMLNFGEETRILTAQVTDAYPESLLGEMVIALDPERYKVIPAPVLLNKGWYFTIAVLTTHYKGFKVEGVVEGIPNIRKSTRKFREALLSLLLVLLVVALFFAVWQISSWFALVVIVALSIITATIDKMEVKFYEKIRRKVLR